MRPDLALVGPYPRSGLRHDGDSGVASYTANLAHALAGLGLRVCVVAPRLDGEPDRAHDGPVEVRRLFTSGRVRAVPEALAAARRTGAAQVHVQLELFLYGGASALPVTLAALARHRRTGPPTTLTLHQVVDPATVDRRYTAMHRVGVPPRLARLALAGVQRALPRLVDEVVVHEPAFAAHVPGAHVVPHGIEVPEATGDRDAARRRLGLDPGTLVATSFGFVAPYKGLETALAAHARTRGDVTYVVAGGAHPRLAAQGDDYERRLAEQHPRARFTGFVPDGDVADWFRATDVLVLCYPEPHASSGPLALALAHGTPVLLSQRLADVVGAPDLGVGEDADPATWARRLDELATDPSRLDRLRDRVAALAADRTWPAVARRHVELYEGLGHEHRAAAADRAVA